MGRGRISQESPARPAATRPDENRGGRWGCTEGRDPSGAQSPDRSLAGASRGTSTCRSRKGSTQRRLCLSRRPALLPSDTTLDGGWTMEVLFRVCCGLDVHKDTVVACLSRLTAAGERVKQVRTFGTTRAGLRRLAAWLRAAGCTHLALESTGVYWKNHEGRALTGTG